MNGIRVVKHNGHDTIFIPLPRDLWVEINGGCQCGKCGEVAYKAKLIAMLERQKKTES